MALYLGIDFGTSTNYIVSWDSNNKKIDSEIMEFGGNNVIDNIIHYGNGNTTIGKTARGKYITDPMNVVRYIKRELDKPNYTVFIPALARELSAREIASDILFKIKEIVRKNHGNEEIEGVVMTVPFAFLHKERVNIKKAAEEAGLKVIGLLEEPVAAAISYVKDNNDIFTENSKKIMVFDLGGGTLDVTIFECHKKGEDIFIEVLNTDGDKYLGGKDVDDILSDMIQKEANFYMKDIVDKSLRKKFMEEISNLANQTKEELSEDDEVEMFEMLGAGKIEFEKDITQDEFERLLVNSKFISRIEETIEDAIFDIDLDYKDIDEVILVGGSSRLIPVQNLLIDLFEKEPIKVKDPSTLVGRGAALYCEILIDKVNKYHIIPRLSQGIGIDKNGKFECLIDKNSKYNSYSEIEWYNLKNSNEIIRIDIYQGNTEILNECSIVGTIEVDRNLFRDELGIRLGIDSNGIIKYKLYSKNDFLEVKLEYEGELTN